MYKRILIPNDGSEISSAAAHAGVEFAKQSGVEIVGVFVAAEYHYPVNVEILQPDYPTEEEYEIAMRNTGENHFANMRSAAADSGLKFSAITAFSAKPAQKIVEVAEDKGCDLIFMGSHGRGGWGQILLGSTTAKVLSLCQIPVLVYRMKKEALRTHPA